MKKLAPVIGRSASAVALKLANFARLDPALQERNISGMSHGSKGEAEIWKEFNDNWENLAFQSEMILAKYLDESVENTSNILKEDLPKEGIEREAVVRKRVNQSFFRKTILASYDNRCCVRGLSRAELLVASHIVPWAQNKDSRMKPGNGLCLNALHDKAFDRGLITVTPDYLLKISEELLDSKKSLPDNFFHSLPK